MNPNELTEREEQIWKEDDTKKIEAAKAARKEVERLATKSGRYPLWLAVEMMTDNLKARWVLGDKLREEASLGRLPLYRRGDVFPDEYRLSPLVLRESDEYIWDDLNNWLAEHAKQIKFRFDPPQAQNDTSGPAGTGEPVEVGADNSATKDDEQEQAVARSTNDEDADAFLANLFDGVPVGALESMFPAQGKWKSWKDRAKRNGLANARTGRGQFNPYLAGIWFVQKNIDGWDLARVRRRLASNLPARSVDSKHLLTGELE